MGVEIIAIYVYLSSQYYDNIGKNTRKHTPVTNYILVSAYYQQRETAQKFRMFAGYIK